MNEPIKLPYNETLQGLWTRLLEAGEGQGEKPSDYTQRALKAKVELAESKREKTE